MWKLLILGIILVWLAPRIWHNMDLLGYHSSSVYKHYPGKCSLVKGTEHGSEDFHPIGDGKVIISSGLRFMHADSLPAYKGRKGKLLLFDTRNPDSGTKELAIKSTEKFNAEKANFHGISAHWNNKGDLFIYVINHASSPSSVEKFSIDLKHHTATHLKSISDPLFIIPNDLAVVDEDEFYITNYLAYPRLKPLDDWLHAQTGSVLYYDGSQVTTVLYGLQNPNGIIASQDGRTLFLSLFGEKQILKLKANRGDLRIKQTIQLHTSVDNLQIEEKGDKFILYGGTLPVLWKTRKHFVDPEKLTAPTQALKITVPSKGEPDVIEIFADDGSLIPTSSVAMVIGNKLLIGGVASHGLICDMKCYHED